MGSKRKFAVTGILLIVTAIFSGGYVNSKKPTKDVIKIGLTLPLSGNSAHMGNAAKAAAELALSDARRSGLKHNYELIIENDAMELAKALSNAKKFVYVDKVKAIVSFAGGPGNIVNEVAEHNEVIHFGWTTDRNVAKGKYNFVHSTQPEQSSAKFAKEFSKRKLDNIYFLTLNHNGVNPIVNKVVEKLRQQNVHIIGMETFNPGEKDFRILLMKAEAQKPDIYFLCSFAAEMELLRKQMIERKIRTPVTSVDCLDLLKNNELYNDSWYVGDSAEKNDKILETLRKNKIEPTRGTTFVYDIVKLLIWAFENTPETSAQINDEAVIETIENQISSFSSIFGELEINKDGVVKTEALVKEIKNGKIKVIE